MEYTVFLKRLQRCFSARSSLRQPQRQVVLIKLLLSRKKNKKNTKLVLYQDAFEDTFLVCSTVDHMQLLLLCNEKNFEEFDHYKVFSVAGELDGTQSESLIWLIVLFLQFLLLDWCLTLHLKALVDLALSTSRSHRLLLLDVLIQEYLDSRKGLFLDDNWKPKHDQPLALAKKLKWCQHINEEIDMLPLSSSKTQSG